MTTERRLNRIFRPDGRVLIVAMDHGLFDGPCRGLEKPAEDVAITLALNGHQAFAVGELRQYVRVNHEVPKINTETLKGRQVAILGQCGMGIRIDPTYTRAADSFLD